MANPEKLRKSKENQDAPSLESDVTQFFFPPGFNLVASLFSSDEPRSLTKCLEPSALNDEELKKEISLIRKWIQKNPGHDDQMDWLIGQLMEFEKVRDERAGEEYNRERMSTREYNKARKLSKSEKRKQIKELESPTGHEPGVGGWLEASAENNALFDAYFSKLLPSGISVDDLKVLSSSVTSYNSEYKELPPPDLWPNMKRALLLIKKIEAESGITFKVLSGYRSDVVNALSGGAKNSAHLKYNGLDLQPQGDQRKAEAFLKDFWFTKGRDENMGFGAYSRNRVHIDASGYRRWPDAWKAEVASTWATKKKKYYPD